MGVPLRLVSLPDKTHFDCLLLQDHKPKTPQTQWLRVQDQRRPRRAAPTFLLFSPRGKSRSSRKLSVSWTQTKTVFCLPQTLSPPSTLLANPSPMVMLFAEKMAGGADDDDTILKAFDAFEVNGKIDADMFKHSLMTFGDKFSASEVDNAFGEFLIEDGMIDAAHLKGLMVSKKEEEAE